MKFILFLIASIFATTVNAQEFISCEARTVSLNHQTLESHTYEKIFPTIIMDEGGKTLSFIYSQHGMQWESEYTIEIQNEDRLIGVEHFDAVTISVFHYDKKDKIFNIFFSGGEFGDLSGEIQTGKCFG